MLYPLSYQGIGDAEGFITLHYYNTEAVRHCSSFETVSKSMYPEKESNPHHLIRSQVFYPLKYRGIIFIYLFIYLFKNLKK